jgi:hypothetical protein
MLALMQNPPDALLLAAALEGPPEWSGLTNEMRADVEKAYVKAHHAPKLRTLDELQEALDVTGAAADIAAMNICNSVDLPPHEFDRWFANGDKRVPLNSEDTRSENQASHWIGGAPTASGATRGG